jgi:light-harvesting complex I chlorophyll a/b binding protein 4
MIHSIFALALLSTAAAFTNVRVASKSSNVVMMSTVEKSKSLPFLPQPANIVGMAGDVGFDPLGFSNFFDIRWLREAEVSNTKFIVIQIQMKS